MATDKQNAIRRNVGVDLIKVLACMGVVSLHTVVPEKGLPNMLTVLVATISIPLFFMASGYLMMGKSSLDYKYALKKIMTILLLCLAWEFLHALAYYLYYREMRNFVESFVLDFFQKGLFYHFWYMGALIIVYLFFPLLHKLLHKSIKAYTIMLLVICGVNICIDVISFTLKRQFVLEIPQNLRCWFWLLYAMLGGYAAANARVIECLTKRIKLWHVVVSLALMILWIYITGKHYFDSMMIESYYGALPVQGVVLLLFLYVEKINFSLKWSKVITYLSGLTLGIYIMHPFVLAVLDKFIPSFTDAGMIENILFWIVTTAACGIITAVVQRLPLINRLLKL